jgi:hypothetical protein
MMDGHVGTFRQPRVAQGRWPSVPVAVEGPGLDSTAEYHYYIYYISALCGVMSPLRRHQAYRQSAYRLAAGAHLYLILVPTADPTSSFTYSSTWFVI